MNQKPITNNQKRSLIFFPTAVCDSNCLHCFYHEAVDAAKTGQEITRVETRRLALAMGPIRNLSISGGEPVLRGDLIEVLESILVTGRPRSVTLPTGGLHPEAMERAAREILRILPSTRLTAALSFEGPPDVHDRMRGVPGAYEKLRKTHDLLAGPAQAGALAIKLVTTICNLNLASLPQAFECAKKDFPAAIFHHLEIMRGSGRDASAWPPDPEVLAGMRPRIIEHWMGYGRFYGQGLRGRLARAAKARLHDLSIDYLRGGQSMPRCHAFKTHLVVSERGDVSFCELTAPIGNLREGDLDEILAGPEAEKRIAAIKSGCRCAHSCFTPSNLIRSPKEIFRAASGLLIAKSL